MNLIKCSSCGAPLIAEELEGHVCFTKKVESIRCYGWGEYYVFDGKKWYRWFPDNHTILNTPNKHTEDEQSSMLYTVAFGGVAIGCPERVVIVNWVS